MVIFVNAAESVCVCVGERERDDNVCIVYCIAFTPVHTFHTFCRAGHATALARQRHHVFSVSGQNNVDYCNMSVFVAVTPYRH